ncbi:MAG: hypothetical protein Q7S92_01070 [Candidatus Diapherotrites archaeon]|nr:hypothetical protein [Candidatus Diapherotrites archaeon]
MQRPKKPIPGGWSFRTVREGTHSKVGRARVEKQPVFSKPKINWTERAFVIGASPNVLKSPRMRQHVLVRTLREFLHSFSDLSEPRRNAILDLEKVRLDIQEVQEKYSDRKAMPANEYTRFLVSLSAVFRTGSQCLQDEYVRNAAEQMEKNATTERTRVNTHQYRALTVTRDFFKPKLDTLDEVVRRLVGNEVQAKELIGVREQILEAVDTLQVSIAERN